MKFFVGVTDHQWFDYLRRLSARPSEPPDEVNFWQLAFDFNKIMTQNNEKGAQTKIEILINYNDR